MLEIGAAEEGFWAVGVPEPQCGSDASRARELSRALDCNLDDTILLYYAILLIDIY